MGFAETGSRIISVNSPAERCEMPRPRRSSASDSPWLSPAQLRAWVAYMRVQLQMNYEINRQLQRDSDLSLSDYHVLNALTNSPEQRMQVTDLAALIGWERSRLSHHLRRLSERGLTMRVQSTEDGRATDAGLPKKGLDAIVAAAPGHATLVKKLFFEPLPDELVAPFTAALAHIQASLNLNDALPAVPREIGGFVRPQYGVDVHVDGVVVDDSVAYSKDVAAGQIQLAAVEAPVVHIHQRDNHAVTDLPEVQDGVVQISERVAKRPGRRKKLRLGVGRVGGAETKVHV